MFPKTQQNNEIEKELNQIKTIKEQIDGKYFLFETNKYKYLYNLQKFEAIRSCGNSTFNWKTALDEGIY